jgi:hypothetical protein
MREFNLKLTFPRTCPFAKYFEDQRRAVEDLALPFSFKVALLNWRDRTVDHDNLDMRFRDHRAQRRGLAGTKKKTWVGSRNRHDVGEFHVELDCTRKAHGFE